MRVVRVHTVHSISQTYGKVPSNGVSPRGFPKSHPTPDLQSFYSSTSRQRRRPPFGRGEFVGNGPDNLINVEVGVHLVYNVRLTTCRWAHLNQQLTVKWSWPPRGAKEESAYPSELVVVPGREFSNSGTPWWRKMGAGPAQQLGRPRTTLSPFEIRPKR